MMKNVRNLRYNHPPLRLHALLFKEKDVFVVAGQKPAFQLHFDSASRLRQKFPQVFGTFRFSRAAKVAVFWVDFVVLVPGARAPPTRALPQLA